MNSEMVRIRAISLAFIYLKTLDIQPSTTVKNSDMVPVQVSVSINYSKSSPSFFASLDIVELDPGDVSESSHIWANLAGTIFNLGAQIPVTIKLIG